VTFVVGLAAALLFFILSARARTQLIDGKLRAATTVTEILASSLSAPLDFEDTDAIGAELATLAARRDVLWVGVIGTDGKLVQELTQERSVDPRAIVPAGARVLPDRIEVVKPVVGRNGKALGDAAVVFSLSTENAAFEETRAGILQICVLLAFGTSLLLVLLARLQIVKPLAVLGDAAREVEEGHARVDVRIDSRDEVGDLARAFNAMSAAVRDRELRLAQARDELREILDNMRQAIVVFDKDGRVGGVRSASAEAVFGRADLDGAEIDRVLYPDRDAWEAEPRALSEWRVLAFSQPRSRWSDVAELAPSEIVLPSEDGQARVLELEFEPLFRDDELDRVMLLATDVTERRRLIQLGERRELELAGLRRFLSSGALFVSFLEGGKKRLQRARELLASRGTEAARNEAFQHLHTLRSEAHTFELVSLESSVREAEALLADLKRAGADGAPASIDLARTTAELETALETAEADLLAAERRFVELSPTGEEVLRRVTVDRADVERLVALLGPRKDEVGRVLERLHARPLGELCATLAERASAWADALGKQVRLEVSNRTEPVPQRLAEVLPAILTHLVRNAVAHGIETPAERAAAGKAAIGSIRIATARVDSGLTVLVEDDGGGLGAGNDEAAIERIFEPGFSTSSDVLELSGQGMGLPAARREARAAGYDVRVASRASPGMCFVVAPLKADKSMEGVA
jgi:HAMP domain-containing protein